MNLSIEALKTMLDTEGNSVYVIKSSDFSLFYELVESLKGNEQFFTPDIDNEFNSFFELYNITNQLLIDYMYNARTKNIVLLYEQFIQIIDKFDFQLLKSKIVIINNNIERYRYLPINENEMLKKIRNKDINDIDDEEMDLIWEYYDEVRVDQCNGVQRIVVEYKDAGLYKNLLVEEKNLIDVVTNIESSSIREVLPKINSDNALIYSAQDFEIGLNSKYFNRIESDCFFEKALNNKTKDVYVIAHHDHLNSSQSYLRAWKRVLEDIIFLEYDIDVDSDIEEKYDIDILLQKYWNSNSFREYNIYDVYSDKYMMKKISQSDIIKNILSEYYKSKRSSEWRDIFFIASTGAGKSLLYQLPSIILNNEDKVVIVVSPLKALMNDQLQQMNSKGLKYATYINSDISYSEQIERLNGIKNGVYSLIYVSPEFLQKYSSAKYLVGDREIGLVVVDEAHCVSTWGKDFRSDYGYLGDYIKRYRKEMQFPILALTATAVWGGEFDTLNEIIKYLDFKPEPIIYYTDIKRTNIEIDIKRVSIPGNYRESKSQMTVDEITKLVNEQRKAIVYFPWKSQIQNIYIRLQDYIKPKVAIYTGDTKGEEGKEIIEKFRTGEYFVVLATKAFGMGIDISDIKVVYHHAIPGNLADYSQEIGRAARKSDEHGYAYTLFNQKDFQYWRVLKGISRPTQWELKLVVDKLYDEFKNSKKKRQQRLLPLDTFAFIFGEDDSDSSEQKIRNALFLIEKDFQKQYDWNIMNVYPKDEYGNYYCTVEDGRKEQFIKKYGKYVKEMRNADDNIRLLSDKRCLCKDVGDILEIDLKKLWEEQYDDKNYRAIKYLFYNDKLFNEFSVVPRTYIQIELDLTRDEVLKNLEKALNVIKSALSSQDKYNKNELEKSIRNVLKNELGSDSKELVNKYLHICTTFLYMEVGDTNYSHKMIIRKRDEESEYLYVASRLKISLGLQNLIKIFNNRFEDSEIYERFIIPPYIGKSIYTCETMDLAYILETLGLASFKVMGGHMPYVNIIVNSVDKLANAYYKNQLLVEMRTRDNNEIKIIEKFINAEDDKWGFIENYFLGKLNV